MPASAFLETILRGVAIHPEAASVSCADDQQGTLCLIRVSKADMPRLIGKKGQNINALRLLMNVYAKDGPKVSIKVEEPTNL